MTKAELREKIRSLVLQVRGEQSKADEAAIAYDELTKFPELKDIIVSLMTHEFDSFLPNVGFSQYIRALRLSQECGRCYLQSSSDMGRRSGRIALSNYGRISIGVPSGTRLHTSAISALDIAMQPSVQSPGTRASNGMPLGCP